MKQVKLSLIKSSTKADVRVAGGKVYITGLPAFNKSDLVNVQQMNARNEVVQVVKVGGNSYTPVASKTYRIELLQPGYARTGNDSSTGKQYSYTTPADLLDLGANAAAQREAIHAILVSAINADAYNYVTAVSLGTGTGFTITDDAGYRPARVGGSTNGRSGATTVVARPNSDGSGWTQAAVTVTTAAVYGFGIGSRMDDDTPSWHLLTGNLISGELDAPATTAGAYADAGQKYNAFFLTVKMPHEMPTITPYVKGYAEVSMVVFCDNGTGTSTTNLTGYNAFEREMFKLMFGVYEGPQTTLEFFDKPLVVQAVSGVSPYTGALAGTAGQQRVVLSPYGALHQNQIGTQTIFGPTLQDDGLLIDQDKTATEGAHYSQSVHTLSDESYIVGKTAFSMICKVKMGDWTDGYFQAGFRKKAAFTAAIGDYTDLASIGTSAAGTSDYIATIAELNSAAEVETISTTAIATDGAIAELVVSVALNGAVTAKCNGVSYPIYSVGTTPMVFDAGDEIIGFFQGVTIGGDAAMVVSMFACVPAEEKAWRN